MGSSNSNNDNASIAHILLCCVAGKGVSALIRPSCGYVHIGMHFNFFVHGVLGFLILQPHQQRSEIKSAYDVSLKATRCLAVPCLMADLYKLNPSMSHLHVLSGLVPFAMLLSKNNSDNEKIATYCIAANITVLAWQALQHSSDWGWYTAGAAVIACFVIKPDDKLKYPVALALLEYCTYRVIGIGSNC